MLEVDRIMLKLTILFALMILVSVATFALLILTGAPEVILTSFIFYFVLGKKATHKFYSAKQVIKR